jgi:hypothetical protein
VKCVAQRCRVDDRVQVPYGAPSTVEAIQTLASGVTTLSQVGGPKSAATASIVARTFFQTIRRQRRDVHRLDRIEARQAGKLE